MSGSTDTEAVAAVDDAAAAALAKVEKAMAEGVAAGLADATAQRLLLAGIRLYAHKIDAENRAFPPVPPGAGLTATEVAVCVTELMREVDLNMFDLAMWSGRARPGEKT